MKRNTSKTDLAVGFEIGKTSPTTVDTPSLRNEKSLRAEKERQDRMRKMMVGEVEPRTPAEIAAEAVSERKWSTRPKHDY